MNYLNKRLVTMQILYILSLWGQRYEMLWAPGGVEVGSQTCLAKVKPTQSGPMGSPTGAQCGHWLDPES
ncbi:hypothetical protein ACTXT7_002161 [Hymenolepis weldensis]